MIKQIITSYSIVLLLFGVQSLAYGTPKLNMPQQCDSIQIKRIADLGSVWGVINYFHPTAGKGILSIDSLFINYSGDLINSPTEENFRKALNGMFARLGDNQSGVINTGKTTTQNYPARKNITRSELASGCLYIAAPQDIFKKQQNADSVFAKSIVAYKSFVVDLRNSKIDYNLGLAQYTNLVQPLIARIINKTLLLPAARGFYYKGLLREDFNNDVNILPVNEDGAITDHLQVYFGLRNTTEGAYLLPDTKKEYGTRRFCFIVNRFVNINTLRAILALKNRNLCNVIIDGPIPEYVYGDFYRMTLADNISVKIKTTELIYEDGTIGPNPDLILPASADTSLHAPVIKAACGILQKAILPAPVKHPENTVYIRKPQSDYPTNGVPDAKLRLLGLFNLWNAIRYFSPNKDLIAYNWDKALVQFIPEFLNAKTDSAYFMTLMHLTACINDGHSILISKRGGRSPNGVLDGNLPIGADLVDGKVFITAVLDDKTQQAELSKLTEGDELIAINNVPVVSLAEQWRPYIVASNTAGFNREYYYTWLTNGIVGSKATLTVSTSGKIKQVILNRIKRDDYYGLRGKISRNPLLPPYCKIIKGNIGYMRVNRIYTNELDSLANMLKNCKSIILDCRGYPKDYKIGSELAAYIAAKTDTVAINKFPYVTSPDLLKNQVIIDYEITVVRLIKKETGA